MRRASRSLGARREKCRAGTMGVLTPRAHHQQSPLLVARSQPWGDGQHANCASQLRCAILLEAMWVGASRSRHCQLSVIVGHNDEAGSVYRVYNGHRTAFANEYSHFRFTPFIGPTGSATAIALGYYREPFHACNNVLCGLSHSVPLVQQGYRATMRRNSTRRASPQ